MDNNTIPTLTVYELTKNSIKFNLKGVTVTDANGLRRAINNVSSLAVSDVSIEINTSILPDEEIVYRLMLLPIPYDTEERFYSLDVSNRDISARDLGFDNDFVITKLSLGQRLKLSFNIIEGSLQEHAKFSPVTVSTYKQLSKDTYDFYVETTGVMSPELILEKAISNYYQ